jgi:hypothetical protein
MAQRSAALGRAIAGGPPAAGLRLFGRPVVAVAGLSAAVATSATGCNFPVMP